MTTPAQAAPRYAMTADQTVRIGPYGRYTYRVPAWASSELWFVHSRYADAAASRVTVRVRAALTLRRSRRALRNGQSVVVRGRARRRGVLVELQARRGGGWQTFATVDTRRGGRFRFRYRFTRSFGVRRYKIRARVPAQSSYPYEPGASRSVRLRVVG